MKRSLVLEKDVLISESSSKKACISPINDYNRKSNDTSKCTSVKCQDLFPVSVNQYKFSELLSSYVTDYKLSINNSKTEYYMTQENCSNRESNSKTACISAQKYDHGESNNNFEINSNISNVKCEKISVSKFMSATPAIERSLTPERNDQNSESHICDSTIVANHGKTVFNTSECSDIIPQELFSSLCVNQNIFSELLPSHESDSRISDNNSEIEKSSVLANKVLNREYLSKAACVSTRKDDQELANEAFKITNTVSDGKCKDVAVNNPVCSTATNIHLHDVNKLYAATSNSLDGMVSTLNKLDSTNKTLVSELESSSEDSSASARNFGLCSYDHISKNIKNIMISLMKDEDSDIKILPFLIEKIRIRNKLTINLINRITKLKNALKEAKVQIDNLKPEHPNEKQTQCVNVLETVINELDNLPFILLKNTAQGISDVIPKRIKSIILENKSSTLNISTLETFFNKVRNKKNVRTVANSLKIPVGNLKKQLNEIKLNYNRNPEKGNNEEKLFIKRLERIIISLKRKPSTSARSSTHQIPDVNHEHTKEIISKIKNGALDVTELMNYLNKAKNRKNLISIAKSSKIDTDDLKKNLKAIKSKIVENLETDNEGKKLFVKRIKRIINSLNNRPSTFVRSSDQEIPNAFPERTKKIISEMKNGTLDVTKFMKFLNKAKNRKNLITIVKSSKNDVDDLKKNLNAMKSRYDRNLESANDTEKQFVKWLEGLIDQLESIESLNTSLKLGSSQMNLF